MDWNFLTEVVFAAFVVGSVLAGYCPRAAR